MKAHMVVGLGFGDEGKGATVDWLCRKYDAQLVVRFNGGAQCGHNVVTAEGKHHCFAQFGSGTLAGAATHLDQHVIFNPISFMKEAEVLDYWLLGNRHPAHERVTIDERCLVTNPFQIRANRLREAARGDGRHGSCGMGIGETVADALSEPEHALRAWELNDPIEMGRKIYHSFHRKLAEFGPAIGDVADVQAVVERLQGIGQQLRVVSPRWAHDMIACQYDVVFEGAQGVLLDEDYGFAPHTTWSKTTLAHAEALTNTMDCEVRRIGVLRAFMTRHGAGPFVTEVPGMVGVPNEHNGHGEFQGDFRVGRLDLAALNYAIDRCPVDELAVTCWDAIDAMGSHDDLLVCTDYSPHFTVSAERLGRTMPVYRKIRPHQLIETVERTLDKPIMLMSRGPTADDRIDRTL